MRSWTFAAVMMTLTAVAPGCDKDEPGTGQPGTGGASAGGSPGAGGAGSGGDGVGGTGGGAVGDAGSGGAGSGGASSGGGADAAGDGTNTGGACNIPCIATLIDACVPSGSCVQQAMIETFSTNLCYANAVKVTVTAAAGATVFTYRRPGGDVCYSVEVITQLGSQSGTFTYKAPTGGVVATGSFNLSDNDLSVECGGATYETARRSCLNLPLLGSGSVSCAAGSCP